MSFTTWDIPERREMFLPKEKTSSYRDNFAHNNHLLTKHFKYLQSCSFIVTIDISFCIIGLLFKATFVGNIFNSLLYKIFTYTPTI